MNISNHVQLIGHVGQDPEVVVLESDRKLTRFSMATNEVFFNSSNEKVERTYWHSIVFWHKAAERIEQYVKKGQRLAVEGKLITRSWEDSAGVKHYRTEVVGKSFLML